MLYRSCRHQDRERGSQAEYSDSFFVFFSGSTFFNPNLTGTHGWWVVWEKTACSLGMARSTEIAHSLRMASYSKIFDDMKIGQDWCQIHYHPTGWFWSWFSGLSCLVIPETLHRVSIWHPQCLYFLVLIAFAAADYPRPESLWVPSTWWFKISSVHSNAGGRPRSCL